MPEVSVLIPTYNRANYLAQAIESVLTQTHTDWELVVVDDGSTDDTPSVVARYGQRLRYLQQPNRGVSAARNRAFRESSGGYVVFLDSDDLLLPDALEALARALRTQPDLDAVYSDGYIIDESGQRVAELSDYRPTPVDDTFDRFVLDSAVDLHSTMIRRASLERVEGPFDEQMVGYEDRDLFMRLKAAGCRFGYVPGHTCCYRFHGGNKSAPKSAWAERRRLSLIRNRNKVLAAPWFAELSADGQYRFFLDLLTSVLHDDYERQEKVLAHPAFGRLPAQQRARLLYCLAVENSLGAAPWLHEFAHLVRAIRLSPLDPRAYVLLAVSLPGPAVRRWALRTWRDRHIQPQTLDPVTRILRAKDVA